MKSVIRNFAYVVRRFKTATALNILCLSVAFASFMIIMMQIAYDTGFDKSIKDHDRIYRADIVLEDGGKWAVVSRPLAELLFGSSPHIVAGTLWEPFPNEFFFSIPKPDGSKAGYLEEVIKVTPSFTQVFHFDMVEGTDKALGEPDKILIPQSIAEKMFGNESALDRQLQGDKNYTVGGVFRDFPRNTSLQNKIYVGMSEDENKTKWGDFNYCIFIRVDNPEAVEGLSENVQKLLPAELKEDFGDAFRFQFTPLHELYYTTDVVYDLLPKSSRQTIAVLFAIAFVIVLMGGINFTNFSVALTPMRIKSINTQKVLGATGSELRMILLAEAVGTALVAYVLSLALVYAASYTPVTGLVNADISLSEHPSLIALTAALAFAAGMLSGLYPAIYMTSFPPALILKGSFGLSPKGKRMRNILIGTQFVASLVLIMCVSFMFLQNRFMQRSPLGFDKDALIVADLSWPANQKWDVFKDRLNAFPGIEGAARSLSLLSSAEQYMSWGRKYRDKDIRFQCLPVDPSFLDVAGIKVAEGRNFAESDQGSESGVLILNEKARKEYGLELNSRIGDMEIIGFIPDIKFATFRTEVEPMAFYVSSWYKYLGLAYIKVTRGSDLYAAFDHVKSTLASITPDFPLNVRFFDDVLNATYQKERKLTALITLFSLIAILISVAGVFGLVVFETGYRRREISIRKIMGSSIAEVLALFNKTYIRILAVCFIIAVPAAYYIIRKWLENFAYKTPVEWWVFLLAGLALLLVVLCTVNWQSWRAATANPADALKNE